MTTQQQRPGVQLPHVVGGVKFMWREESNTLEPVGGMLGFGGFESRQQNRRTNKPVPPPPPPQKREKERLTPLFTGGPVTINTNSYRSKYSNLPKYVTMLDVKAVALANLSSKGIATRPFNEYPLVDEIICCTLKFFEKYFITQENKKPRPMMALMIPLSGQSLEEQQKELMDERALAEAHKLLSSVYGAFLLGQRCGEMHHLNAGKLRYSKTRKDKLFFEGLYELLITCTALTFQEADHDTIRTEMGRLFRSDSFNINQRVTSERELEERYPHYFKLKGLVDSKSGPTAAEYRRMRNQRSSFGKALSAHSPMVTAMLDNPLCTVCSEVTSSDLLCFGIGIIGKTIRDYDLSTLKKLGEKEKKDLELNENFGSSRASSATTAGPDN